MNREIIIGDIHGCLSEFDELLKLVEFRQGEDRLVLLGDLIDRGPDPVGVVRRARELKAESVLGNHCEKAIRWRRYEARKALTGQGNPMRAPKRERLQEWLSLSEDDVQWLADLPIQLEIAGGWLAVHAGFEPGRSMEDQRPDRVIRVRYVDPATGEMIPYPDGKLEQPPNTVYWTELWKGPPSVVYGHAVHSLTEPRVDTTEFGTQCVGLDTGCVFGGHLSAMVRRISTAYLKLPGRNNFEIAQVKAGAVYQESLQMW